MQKVAKELVSDLQEGRISPELGFDASNSKEWDITDVHGVLKLLKIREHGLLLELAGALQQVLS